MNATLPRRLFACFFAIACMMANAAEPGAVPEGYTEEEWAALSEDDRSYVLWSMQFLDSLDPQHGGVAVNGAPVDLDLGEDFYYLSAADARRVLTEAWGNPPDDSTLGMIFPKQYNPLESRSWGLTIEYTDEGHVSDEDAADIDYDDLLESMQADTADANEQRIEAGYEAVELVGWAAPPSYDQANHRLHWAKELRFGDAPENTLNYSVRVLGREGTLELNFIANMTQLDEINAALPGVLNMASFREGQRYADFDPSTDRLAAYGIAGLIAGGALAKKGVFAALLVFLKKFGVYLLLGAAAGVSWLRKAFKRQE